MGKNISNDDVNKAKQLLADARSDSESANSISNYDIEKARQILSGEENKPDADGYRAGGKVNISNFKGGF